jgi:hypothetical protein
LFQSLPEEKEMTEDVCAETTLGGHPKVAVDFEVMKITIENMTTSCGLEGVEVFLRETTDVADQPGETEV